MADTERVWPRSFLESRVERELPDALLLVDQYAQRQKCPLL